jgi:hypothetical protein
MSRSAFHIQQTSITFGQRPIATGLSLRSSHMCGDVCWACAGGSRAGPRDRVPSRRHDRLAQGPPAVWRRDRNFPLGPVHLSLAAKAGKQMGKSVYYCRATLRLSHARTVANGVGARRPCSRRSALLHHVSSNVRKRLRRLSVFPSPVIGVSVSFWGWRLAGSSTLCSGAWDRAAQLPV